MTLISKLKEVLGLDSGRRDKPGGTTVRVEREPRVESERAVKESPGPSPTEPATPDDTAAPTEPEEPVRADPTAAADDAPAAAEAGVEDAIDEAEAAPAGGSDEPVESLDGIGPAYAERLAESGVETVGDLAAADAADLDAQTDIGEGRLAGWIERARDT